jgi:hypothetical protein
MAQDQQFKDLLQAFFGEFLELFYPDVAARLDLARVTFLDKETFTDVPEGSRREADLVAHVFTQSGEPELILVHVEVQTQRRLDFTYRMWEYYALLRFRHRLPVFPIVVYLAPGTGGVTEETYEEALFGRTLLTFRYQAVGLPDLPSDDYVEHANPLGAALSALMRPGRTGRALRKALSLRRTEQSGLDEARRALLRYLIDIYLPLNTDEEEELRRIIGQPEFEEVQEVITSFEQRALERGLERGIQQGIERGIEQGIEQGIVQGKRDMLLKVARARFGEPTPVLAGAIGAARTAAELDALLDRLLKAASPDEVSGSEPQPS